MKYLNKFHQESTERKLKKIAEMRKTPVDYEKEVKRHREMAEKERLREIEEMKKKEGKKQ